MKRFEATRSFVLALAAAIASLPAHAQIVRRAAQAPSTPVSTARAYVTRQNANAVSVIDTATNAIVGSINVGTSPGRLSISPNGSRAYVPNAGSDNLSVIDTSTNTVVATIAVNDAPAVAAVTPNGARVYVGGANGAIAVVDTATNSVVASVTLGAASTGAVDHIVFSADGARAYANWGSVYVIDTASNTVLSSIYAGNNVTTIAIAPDGAHLYAASQFGYGAFSFYGTLQVVDTQSESVVSSILIWGLPQSMALTPDGTRAYIATPYSWSDTGYGAGYLASPWVTAVNLTTNTLGPSFNAGAQARNVAVSADGSRVYVTTPIANAVKVANVATGVVTATISVAGAPNGIALQP